MASCESEQRRMRTHLVIELPRSSGKTAYDVNITDLIEPERVSVGSSSHEVAFVQSSVDLFGGAVEFVKNPLLDERLLASRLRYRPELMSNGSSSA
jgi:hypothetical protein